jgi:hypothetical protein
MLKQYGLVWEALTEELLCAMAPAATQTTRRDETRILKKELCRFCVDGIWFGENFYVKR